MVGMIWCAISGTEKLALSLAIVMSLLMWGIVYQGYNAIFPSFYPELFPARTRVSAMAISQNIGTMITAMLPALFLAYLQVWHRGGIPYTYQDQAMDPAVAHAICEAADPIAAFCADATLWGPLVADQRLVSALRGAYARVQTFAQRKTA